MFPPIFFPESSFFGAQAVQSWFEQGIEPGPLNVGKLKQG